MGVKLIGVKIAFDMDRVLIPGVGRVGEADVQRVVQAAAAVGVNGFVAVAIREAGAYGFAFPNT